MSKTYTLPVNTTVRCLKGCDAHGTVKNRVYPVTFHLLDAERFGAGTVKVRLVLSGRTQALVVRHVNRLTDAGGFNANNGNPCQISRFTLN
jgi:hypothetical protein